MWAGLPAHTRTSARTWLAAGPAVHAGPAVRGGSAVGWHAMSRLGDGRADGLMGEALDRRGEHVGEGSGRATPEHDGNGGDRRANLDPEAGGEPAGSPAGAPGRHRRASL